jgi:hypothetical protein
MVNGKNEAVKKEAWAGFVVAVVLGYCSTLISMWCCIGESAGTRALKNMCPFLNGRSTKVQEGRLLTTPLHHSHHNTTCLLLFTEQASKVDFDFV